MVRCAVRTVEETARFVIGRSLGRLLQSSMVFGVVEKSDLAEILFQRRICIPLVLAWDVCWGLNHTMKRATTIRRQNNHQRSIVMHNETDKTMSRTHGHEQKVWLKILIVITVFLGCLATRCWLHFFQSYRGDIKILCQLRSMLDGFFAMMPLCDWFMCLESSKLSGASLYSVGAHFYTQLTISGVILIAKRPNCCLFCFPLIVISMLVSGIGCFVATLFGDFLHATVFGVIAANATGNFFFAERKLKMQRQ